MRYTRTNPLGEGELYADGTTVQPMAALGAETHYMPANGGRFPAFIALAKATGGVYAENSAGMTPQRAMQAANLDYTVSTVANPSVSILDDNGVETLVDNRHRATVATWGERPGRPGRRAVFGFVKGRYQPVQNATVADFGQAVMDESGANIVAAGAYGEPQGNRAYFAFKLPEGLLVGGQDPHDLYLTLGTSHDGTTGMWGCIAPIRLQCTNQVAATFGKLSNRFLIRHTGDVASKLAEVRQVLNITGTWTERWAKAAEQLLATPMEAREVTAFVERLMPTPKQETRTQASAARWAARRADVVNLALRAETNTFGRGSAYAAYQAVVEWADHDRPYRAEGRNPAGRWARVVDGDEGERLKVRAAALLLA